MSWDSDWVKLSDFFTLISSVSSSLPIGMTSELNCRSGTQRARNATRLSLQPTTEGPWASLSCSTSPMRSPSKPSSHGERERDWTLTVCDTLTLCHAITLTTHTPGPLHGHASPIGQQVTGSPSLVNFLGVYVHTCVNCQSSSAKEPFHATHTLHCSSLLPHWLPSLLNALVPLPHASHITSLNDADCLFMCWVSIISSIPSLHNALHPDLDFLATSYHHTHTHTVPSWQEHIIQSFEAQIHSTNPQH